MKDRKIYCLNNIAKIGTDGFRSGYTLIDSIEEAAGVLVRSADMKEMAFPAGLRAIARAGAGVNNIPLDRCAEEGIVVFNTPGGGKLFTSTTATRSHRHYLAVHIHQGNPFTSTGCER